MNKLRRSGDISEGRSFQLAQMLRVRRSALPHDIYFYDLKASADHTAADLDRHLPRGIHASRDDIVMGAMFHHISDSLRNRQSNLLGYT